MKNSLGFYQIDYQQGTVQINELISKEDYEYFKKLKGEEYDLQVKLGSGKKKDKKPKDPVLISELNEVKEKLKEFSYPFFVVGSPLYSAIGVGFYEIDEQSGNSGKYLATVTKIENDENIKIGDLDEDFSE
jgi:hypothetical protein